jgi:hypothetical protein
VFVSLSLSLSVSPVIVYLCLSVCLSLSPLLSVCVPLFLSLSRSGIICLSHTHTLSLSLPPPPCHCLFVSVALTTLPSARADASHLCVVCVCMPCVCVVCVKQIRRSTGQRNFFLFCFYFISFINLCPPIESIKSTQKRCQLLQTHPSTLSFTSPDFVLEKYLL